MFSGDDENYLRSVRPTQPHDTFDSFLSTETQDANFTQTSGSTPDPKKAVSSHLGLATPDPAPSSQAASESARNDKTPPEDDAQSRNSDAGEEPLARPKERPASRIPKFNIETFRKTGVRRGDDGVGLPEDGEKYDRLWELFLDVAVDFPEFPFEKAQALDPEARRDLHRRHLDLLLSQIRAWSQKTYPGKLSLMDFARKLEKLSNTAEFQDYRNDLIVKYVKTDWRKEAAARKAEKKKNENVEGREMQDDADEQSIPKGPTPPQNVASAQVREKRARLLELQKERQSSTSKLNQPSSSSSSSSSSSRPLQTTGDVMSQERLERLKAQRRAALIRQRELASSSASRGVG